MSEDVRRFSTRLAALEEASVNLRVQIRSRSRGRRKHRAALDLDVPSLPNSQPGIPLTSYFGFLKENSVLDKEGSVVGEEAEKRRGRGVQAALAALEGTPNRTSPQIASDRPSMPGKGEKVVETVRTDTGHMDRSTIAPVVLGSENSVYLEEEKHGQDGTTGQPRPHVEQEYSTTNGIEQDDSGRIEEQSQTTASELLAAVPPTPVPLDGPSDSKDGVRDLDGNDGEHFL